MASTLLQFHATFGQVHRMGIVEVFGANNPLVKYLNWITVPAFTYEYDRRGSLGGIAYRGLNETYTPSAGLINPVIERTILFGGEVDTDVELVETRGPEYRASQVAAKVKAAALFHLREFFKGDSSANPKAMDGLYPRLTGNQVVSAGTNGGALTIAMVTDLLSRVIGDNREKVLFMNLTDRMNLTNLKVAAAGGAAVADVGKLIDNIDGAPIEAVEEDDTGAQIFPKTETQGSSNVTSSIMCVRFGGSIDGEFTQGLIGARGFDATDQGVRSTVYKNLVDIRAGLAVFHPRAAARLKGVL